MPRSTLTILVVLMCLVFVGCIVISTGGGRTEGGISRQGSPDTVTDETKASSDRQHPVEKEIDKVEHHDKDRDKTPR
jgi:hypothetical protein